MEKHRSEIGYTIVNEQQLVYQTRKQRTSLIGLRLWHNNRKAVIIDSNGRPTDMADYTIHTLCSWYNNLMTLREIGEKALEGD